MAAAALALPGAAARAFSPAVDYAVHCQGCHLADGSATPGSVPALAGTVAVLARTAEGRAYMVRVPGVAQAPLGDAELAALLDWVVERFGGAELEREVPHYTATQVGRLRARPLVDVEGARRRALEAASAGARRDRGSDPADAPPPGWEPRGPDAGP